MKIIAVDPGKVSGVAQFERRGEGPGFSLWTEELPTWEAVDYVHDQLRVGTFGRGTDILVVEAFTISARTLRGTRQYEALESIGALRYLAGITNTPFRLILPATSKRLATDEKLKHLDWYTSSRGGHANDAARLILVTALQEGLIDPKEFTDA